MPNPNKAPRKRRRKNRKRPDTGGGMNIANVQLAGFDVPKAAKAKD